MEPTIGYGKHLALHAKLTGSRFQDVCLGDAEFDNVSLVRAKFHNINFSDITVTAAQIGGATFKHIGLPPGAEGQQRPLRFEEADLPGTSFAKCDLSGVEMEDCKTDGMKIDGILVADMIAAFKNQKR
ncbi:MAG: pentapeptide repeat-containing protein [Verrucomicrobia bacterium]|jgi:uncharacterized protein YjbI with pentapeptide repeats|nr:pentapeptide repeat-containing protein [Verrucomicrobiota bacterium]